MLTKVGSLCITPGVLQRLGKYVCADVQVNKEKGFVIVVVVVVCFFGKKEFIWSSDLRVCRDRVTARKNSCLLLTLLEVVEVRFEASLY